MSWPSPQDCLQKRQPWMKESKGVPKELMAWENWQILLGCIWSLERTFMQSSEKPQGVATRVGKATHPPAYAYAPSDLLYNKGLFYKFLILIQTSVFADWFACQYGFLSSHLMIHWFPRKLQHDNISNLMDSSDDDDDDDDTRLWEYILKNSSLLLQ